MPIIESYLELLLYIVCETLFALPIFDFGLILNYPVIRYSNLRNICKFELSLMEDAYRLWYSKASKGNYGSRSSVGIAELEHHGYWSTLKYYAISVYVIACISMLQFIHVLLITGPGVITGCLCPLFFHLRIRAFCKLLCTIIEARFYLLYLCRFLLSMNYK